MLSVCLWNQRDLWKILMMSLARMPEREVVLECFLILSREVWDREGEAALPAVHLQCGHLLVTLVCFVKCCGFSWYSNIKDCCRWWHVLWRHIIDGGIAERCSRCSCSLQELHDAKQDRDQWRNLMHSSDLIKSWSVS